MYLKNYTPDKLYSKSEITKAIKDWARPPQELVDMSNEHKEIRGNSSVYRCPFCDSITDADIQAAFNIALLGFISDTGKSNKKTDDKLKKMHRDKLLALIKSKENIVNQDNLCEEFKSRGVVHSDYISA